jgi:CheY-like chemotaxis protein/anti-sigma regulatory factor (Ser/Thr protein kinase)
MSKWIEQYSIQAANKQLKLVIKDCENFVYTDPVLLEQVIRNLLSNAIRYTKQGEINIHCTQNNNNLQLHIRDTGIGIPQADKEQIFNEFYQLNNPERDRNKGLGLGLAIVKRISQRLNYQLSFTTKLGKGTEFIVVLPKGKQTEQNKHKPSLSALKDKLNHLKVMVIDNEVQILQAMENIIVSWGSHATSADSTEKALKLIQDGYQPDIILADYRMPGDINGCELIKLVQQQVGDIPGIILTGDTGNDVIAEINAAKQVRLTKPIKPAQLRIAISHLMH